MFTVNGSVIKLEFPTQEDAKHGAYYLQDRGYCVKLMGSALMVSDIDSADLAIAQQTYAAWIDEDVSEFDLA